MIDGDETVFVRLEGRDYMKNSEVTMLQFPPMLPILSNPESHEYAIKFYLPNTLRTW